MKSYEFLLFLAIILAATKLFGLLSRKLNLPQVVGALIAGIIIGPSVLHLISLEGTTGNYLEITAEIGVIILMFSAGLETELTDLKKHFVPSLLTAILGILFPLTGGFLLYHFYFHSDLSNRDALLKAIFIGIVLTATSVSITVETLRELGKLKGAVGTTILGAAVIDDVLGIIILTIATSFKDAQVHTETIVLRIFLYFVFLIVVAIFVYLTRGLYESKGEKKRIAIFALAFCFLLAYASEHFFGVADITGAYFAGVMLSTFKTSHYIEKNLGIMDFLFFSPVFFASIGIKTQLNGMSKSTIIFALLLMTVAVISKMLGCGIGARMGGFKRKDAFLVGIGMISRGEVALIVAQKGYDVGLLDQDLFPAVVFMVIVTTLITPILLKIFMKDKTLQKAES